VSVRRLNAELAVWRGVWQQLVTFLDRIDEAADMDEPQVKMLAALLPVMGVIERARARATGQGLKPALGVAPRGVGLGAKNAAELAAVADRIPGVEDQEFAAAVLKPDDEGKLPDDPPAQLWGTLTMFAFRDEKHGAVEARVPAYDFGPLSGGLSTFTAVVQAGHFTMKERRRAVEEGEDVQVKWSKLRENRLQTLASAPGEKPKSLSATLSPLSASSARAELEAVGAGAVSARNTCNSDVAILRDAGPALSDAGAPDDLLSALERARDALASQALDYQFVADKLTLPGLNQLTSSVLSDVKTRLARADQPAGFGIAPALVTLDQRASPALDDAVSMRLAYPDGTLRTLRALEWALRWHWAFRERWFEARRRLALRPLYGQVLGVFCDSLRALYAGQSTGAPIAGSRLARDVATRASEVPIEPKLDLSKLRAGQIAVLRGDRPTAVLLLGSEIRPAGGGRPSELLLRTAPLEVSVVAAPKLPGIAGLARQGTPLDAGPVSVSDEELRSGQSAAGAHADGLPLEMVGFGSRLALLLGKSGGSGRPTPPAIPAPYPAINEFALEEPVTVGATRLFLKTVPSAPGVDSRRVMMARPGELLLIRGADAEGNWWQSVIEVARADLLTGAAAREQDQATGTPTPVCCESEASVVVITLRDMSIPHDLVRAVALSRDFVGFGPSSLAAREVLPETLDPETQTIHLVDGGVSKVVLRDPELRAAIHVLDSWLPRGVS
jgi:hypothetical protein